MDLFDYVRENTKEKESPLASRLRPTTLEEVVGQQHIIGKGKLLYRAIKADKLSSIIFYGPPGTGKTTLAKVIANTTSAEFKQINATVAGKKDIKKLIHRAVYDKEKGMGSYRAEIDEEAEEFLADIVGGDARMALNAVELAVLTTDRSSDDKIHITLEVLSECVQRRVVRYDKNGDNHYDTVSAFIKSMRGSDPDAAVFYLAKMLYAGEDVKFIARRIMICASEDVGNADPMALTVAVSAAQAVERIGMPESQIILSQAVSYVACAPKSNAAVNAIAAAMDCVKQHKTTVPAHLQDAHYRGHENLGHGIGYKYAHDYPNHYVEQQYLPDEVKGERFYIPGELGYEKVIRDRFRQIGVRGYQEEENKKN